MADTFEQQGKAFWQWLLDNSATLSDGIAFHDYSAENAGRGVIATRDIHVSGEDAKKRVRLEHFLQR